jgi:hypothetical protein
MEALVSGTPVTQTTNEAGDVAAAYLAGYTDGITLLHLKGHNYSSHSPTEPLQRIQDRYLGYIELEHPTPEAHAYVAGFRDAAADNLPCPPHEVEPQVHRVAA